jgi:hypothetical protein
MIAMVVAWTFGVLGLTLIVLCIGALTLPSTEKRPPRPRPQEVVYRPTPLRPVVSVSEAEDDRAIRDHRRLVEQYKDMIDELYDYGEGIVGQDRDRP